MGPRNQIVPRAAQSRGIGRSAETGTSLNGRCACCCFCFRLHISWADVETFSYDGRRLHPKISRFVTIPWVTMVTTTLTFHPPRSHLFAIVFNGTDDYFDRCIREQTTVECLHQHPNDILWHLLPFHASSHTYIHIFPSTCVILPRIFGFTYA